MGYFDGNFDDDNDEEINMDELDDQELAEHLGAKTVDELQGDKYKPYISRIKHACDQETFKQFYAKVCANTQQSAKKTIWKLLPTSQICLHRRKQPLMNSPIRNSRAQSSCLK